MGLTPGRPMPTVYRPEVPKENAEASPSHPAAGRGLSYLCTDRKQASAVENGVLPRVAAQLHPDHPKVER